MATWELHITGRVQGVGFRPMVYQLAQLLGLKGTVRNGNDGVRICFNGRAPQAKEFTNRLLNGPPRLARITAHSLHETLPEDFRGFQIIESTTEAIPKVLLSPDFALCQNCRTDVSSFGNHRFAYPFTTCTDCGPRYGITRSLPYDRPLTTMAQFTMCTSCRAEYNEPANRRHYSQTNSCPDCAISLLEITAKGAQTLDAGVKTITAKWRTGALVALKGMGGFLLTADARNQAAISCLRKRKHRPDKPLAILYPSLESIRADFALSRDEATALTSPVGPIVLLRPKPGYSLSTTHDHIAPGLSKIGVMLPSTPLLQLLLDDHGAPVIATSGNRSGEPITFQEDTAWKDLGDIADFIVGDERPLLLPQDDSVMSFTASGRRIIHRRARGLAPNFFTNGEELSALDIFAAGADLKGSFGLLHRGNIYLSQYLGDLAAYTAQENYRLTRQHLTSVLDASPEVVLTDLHPGYASTGLGEAYAEGGDLPLHPIQHHEAHFAAILGEHSLTDHAAPVLGVIWDGTGLGHDGQLWGGAFFRYADNQITRVDHLPAIPVVAGDQMAKQPRLAALALAGNFPEAQTILRAKFTHQEWKLYQKLRDNPRIYTTSAGRLFDAVASLLGISDKQSYEGMAASRLEEMANSVRNRNENLLPWDPNIIPALLTDLRTCGRAQTALRFHLRLVDLIRQKIAVHQVEHVAFSGGVFQNSLLVDLLETHLGSIHQLYFHDQLSPNDENIAYGQLVHFALQQKPEPLEAHKTTAICV